MLMSFFALLAAGVAGAGPAIGAPLFTLLTGYAFGLCLLAGVLLTADSLSQERRDGTLGLLFLTELKGYDVVLGKFIARSLNAFYGLFALLPIIAVPLMMGGVTGAEFWRMALALLNALFFSLSTGIFVSAFMRDSQRAMGSTLALILLLAGGVPALGALASQLQLASAWASLACVSPFGPFGCARDVTYAAAPGGFWGTLAASHFLGWTFLATASWALPWTWRERTVHQPRSGFRIRSRWRWQGRGAAAIRAMLRQRLLSRNPLLWLLVAERGPGLGVWAVVLAWGVTAVVSEWYLPGNAQRFVPGWYGLQPYGWFGFMLKILVAFQACRFFAEGRRNGWVELVLSTPLTNREIVRGQVLALWRSFRWPLVAFVALLFVPPGLHALGALSIGDYDQAFTVGGVWVYGGFYCLRFWADLCAVSWFGMWLALSLKQPNLAAAKTIFFVLILPAPLCFFDVFASLVFFTWGATKLQQDLRWLIAHQHQGPAMLAPIRPAPGVPPVIVR
jgi:ABC-type transport system involved in multi-copper enzyme maturation permease subunit